MLGFIVEYPFKYKANVLAVDEDDLFADGLVPISVAGFRVYGVVLLVGGKFDEVEDTMAGR